MKTSILNRDLLVINAAKNAGFKVSEFVEHTEEAEKWILDNTVKYEGLPNGATLEAVIINGRFVACEYYNKENSRSLTETQFNQAKKSFNL